MPLSPPFSAPFFLKPQGQSPSQLQSSPLCPSLPAPVFSKVCGLEPSQGQSRHSFSSLFGAKGREEFPGGSDVAPRLGGSSIRKGPRCSSRQVSRPTTSSRVAFVQISKRCSFCEKTFLVWGPPSKAGDKDLGDGLLGSNAKKQERERSEGTQGRKKGQEVMYGVAGCQCGACASEGQVVVAFMPREQASSAEGGGLPLGIKSLCFPVALHGLLCSRAVWRGDRLLTWDNVRGQGHSCFYNS